MDGWVTTAEAARVLGVTHSRVRAMVTSGLLESEKRGRDLFVSEASIRTQKSDYGALTTSTRIKVFVRDRLTCQSCGVVSEEPSQMHVHHKVARKDNGTNALENLDTLCCECHHDAHHGPREEGKTVRMCVRLRMDAYYALQELSERWQMTCTAVVEKLILDAHGSGERPAVEKAGYQVARGDEDITVTADPSIEYDADWGA